MEYVNRGFAVDQEAGNQAVDAGDGDVAGFRVGDGLGANPNLWEFRTCLDLFFSLVNTSDIKRELPNSLPREGGSFAQVWKSGVRETRCT